MKTRITELFGIEHPIVQAPMAGATTPAMAAAAAKADELGWAVKATGPETKCDRRVRATVEAMGQL